MNFLAYALGGGFGGEGQGAGLSAFMPMIIIFAIFYFLMIRPQQKKAKQRKEMLATLKKGDRVVSTGGLLGELTGLTDDLVTMEIAPKVRVKVSRSSISRMATKEEK
jgi:preprotein translocase subunit YajC